MSVNCTAWVNRILEACDVPEDERVEKNDEFDGNDYGLDACFPDPLVWY